MPKFQQQYRRSRGSRGEVWEGFRPAVSTFSWCYSLTEKFEALAMEGENAVVSVSSLRLPPEDSGSVTAHCLIVDNHEILKLGKNLPSPSRTRICVCRDLLGLLRDETSTRNF